MRKHRLWQVGLTGSCACQASCLLRVVGLLLDGCFLGDRIEEAFLRLLEQMAVSAASRDFVMRVDFTEPVDLCRFAIVFSLTG